MNASISAILDRKGRNVFSIAPTLSVADAVAEMNRNRVGSVLVMDGEKILGIFTERDVLRRVVGANVDPIITPITKVMSSDVLTIAPTATVQQVMDIFTEKRCRHLPVVEGGQVLGLISIGDVSRWVANSHRAEAESLRQYISGGLST